MLLPLVAVEGLMVRDKDPVPELMLVPAPIIISPVPAAREEVEPAELSLAVMEIAALLVATLALIIMSRPACTVKVLVPVSVRALVNVTSVTACKVMFVAAAIRLAGEKFDVPFKLFANRLLLA